MEKRVLGKTGESLSVVGFGGIVVAGETAEDATRCVAEAVDRGINYFDVAPTYGNAEERLGPALEPYRDSVFLACKTIERSGEKAAAGLRASLKRLRTDHVDLYQFHGVTTSEDVETITATGGALDAVVKAREEGLVRYIGMSAHSQEAAIALLACFDFDTVMFPLNYVCWHQGRFGEKLLAEAQKRGIGVLALKSLARTKWKKDEKRAWPKCWYAPVETPQEAAMALRFTLSKPVTAAVSPSHAELLWWMCDAAEKLTPLSEQEEKAVAAASIGLDPIFPE